MKKKKKKTRMHRIEKKKKSARDNHVHKFRTQKYSKIPPILDFDLFTYIRKKPTQLSKI